MRRSLNLLAIASGLALVGGCFRQDVVVDRNQLLGAVRQLEHVPSKSVEVADVMLSSGDGFTLKQLHVNTLPKSARDPRELLTRCGLSAGQISRVCLEMLEVGVA